MDTTAASIHQHPCTRCGRPAELPALAYLFLYGTEGGVYLCTRCARLARRDAPRFLAGFTPDWVPAVPMDPPGE